MGAEMPHRRRWHVISYTPMREHARDDFSTGSAACRGQNLACLKMSLLATSKPTPLPRKTGFHSTLWLARFGAFHPQATDTRTCITTALGGVVTGNCIHEEEETRNCSRCCKRWLRKKYQTEMRKAAKTAPSTETTHSRHVPPERKKKAAQERQNRESWITIT